MSPRSPIRDPGAFQEAISFSGLWYPSAEQRPDHREEPPPRLQRSSRPSLPSVVIGRRSFDSEMASVQLDDGPAISPILPSEEDMEPLTDASRTRTRSPNSRGFLRAPEGQRHDRNRSPNSGIGSSLSTKFAPRSSSRLGDDLRGSEEDRAGSRRRALSLRTKRSLSPVTTESTLARTGTMLRKMSERVVNVSNEQVDAIVERNIRRRPSRSPTVAGSQTESYAETSAIDFARVDGASPSARHSHPDKSGESSFPPEIPTILPAIDRNPLRGKSLGLFSPSSRLRRSLLNFLVHPFWEPFILLLIVGQAIILVIESANDVATHPRPKTWGAGWSQFALFAIFVVYTAEIILKIIVSGFIFNPREYSTIDRSVGVRQALKSKANDLFALHRKSSHRVSRRDHEVAPPSLLRSFTTHNFEDVPGSSRQAQKRRLAHRAFLRHSFNRLDFVAVVSFWISFVLEIFGIEGNLYVFRMLSCLRIIRLLGITSGTSVILRSLKRAAPTLLNVSFLIGFFWLLFAIVGVQSFKSSLRRTCVWSGELNSNIEVTGQQPNYTRNYMLGNGEMQFCGGYLLQNGTPASWVNENGVPGPGSPKGFLCPAGSFCVEGENPYNGTVSFDNILQSLEMVFVVISTNTFSDIMYYLADTDYLAAAIYFAAGIVLLTFWLINLLIAVITSSFQVIREESRSSAFMAAETEVEKVEFEREHQRHDDQENPGTEDAKPSRKAPRLKRLYQQSKWFWIAVIAFGLVVNCWRSANMGRSLSSFIDLVQIIVTVTLLVEIALRFLVDWRGFMRSGRDWFDLLLAIVTTIMEIPLVREAHHGQAYAWLSIFQILRAYRVVLAISITRELIMLVLKHVSGVLNLILFVFLLNLIAAIFAVQLFRGELPPEHPDGSAIQVKFNTIFNAYVGMYQILSSENWTEVLYSVTAAEKRYSTAWIGAAFIILWFIFAFFITLNMFIAVIQENFDVSEDQKRLQQVRMFLQQTELGHTQHGTLSLSTIFKLGHVKRQDPLDFGSAATDMLLKDGIVRDFLNEQMEEIQAGDQKAGTRVSTAFQKQSTFGMLQGKQQPIAQRWWQKIRAMFIDSEPNPFYSKLQLTKSYEEVNPATLAKEVVGAQEMRKVSQREYLRKYPKYNISLYLFEPTHPIRRACQRIVGPGRGSWRPDGVEPNVTIWYTFSAFVYLAIVAMVVLACVTTPLYQKGYFEQHGYHTLNWFVLTDIGFAALFTIEAMIKIIADGLWWTPNAHFRSSWGMIDAVVLITLWANVATSLVDPTGGSRAVDAFKALRALRLLNVSDSARDTFHSVIVRGGWKVISAALVSLSLLIPFAIYGLNLFAGKMSFCSEWNGNGNPMDDPFDVFNLTDCVGEYMMQSHDWNFPAPRTVRNNWYSFDSFGEALFLLFQIVSQEGWVQAMWSAQSITGVFTQPANFASQGNAVFFVIFNLLGAVFVLTLFVSVFMRNYTEQTGVAFLTAEQRSWLELRKLLRQVSPSKRPNAKKQRESWQEWCYRRAVTKTGSWQRGVTVVLVLHLILLCSEYYPEPWEWARTRDYTFLQFTCIYLANIAVRIIGLSWTRFRKSAWDMYSIFAVSGTFVTTVLLVSNFQQRYYVQLHKLFLVSIVLLLIPRNNQLDQLFKTAAASLNSIANLLATWFVLFLVYAIALTQAFGLTRFSWNETNNLNVRTVPKALIMLFRTSVGEDWNQLMNDFARVVPPYCTPGETYYDGDCGSTEWAYALFISWNILSTYIFVNLFISLIYESFSYVYQRSSGLSVISREEIRRFKQAWAEYDPNGSGYISKDEFPRFLGELSGVFEMRIYDGDFSVRTLIDDCKLAPQRSTALRLDGTTSGAAEIDLKRLNRRLAELPVQQIRARRARMNTFYEEVLVSADPDRGISFNALLMILAHYKVIDDNKSLKLEEYLRRKARLQRVQEAVNRNIVVGFFDTLYWRRHFRRVRQHRHDARMTTVPDWEVPAIYVQDEDDEPPPPPPPGGRKEGTMRIPSLAVTSPDAPSTPTEANAGDWWAVPRNAHARRSSSVASSDRSSPRAGSAPSPRHLSTHRRAPSGSSIQPDWHFAAAIHNAAPSSAPSSPSRSRASSGAAVAAAADAPSPPPSPRSPTSASAPDGAHDELDAGARRVRARASTRAVSHHEMMDAFQGSSWGSAMRSSTSRRRSGVPLRGASLGEGR